MKCHPAPLEETIMPDIDDKVVIRDGNGIWKPAVVVTVRDDGFVAEWNRNAGADQIWIADKSTIAWRHAGAPLPL